MKSRLFLFLVALFIPLTLLSQIEGKRGSELCSERKRSMTNVDLEGDSPNSPKHSYDVLDYKLNLDIRNCFLTPFPRSFTGNVIVKFRIDTTLSSINLNAINTSIVVSSVGLSGVSFTHTGNILNVVLNRVYTPGEITEVQVNYSHNNVVDGAIYTGNGGFFTDAPPEGARKWFPCWDKPSDKATVDITLKVPANAKIGSNGRLNDSTITGDTAYYHWISRDPVATYLVVLTGKVNYNLNIVYWPKISNPLDSVPLRFYFNPGENPTAMQNVLVNMTTYFSQKFGEHGFEKNGFATAPAPGFSWAGMENQTLTTLCTNCWQENLVSHEFAHQWFGDLVTCATWADVWLNEGFATYCESLWYEKTGGYTAYKNDINNTAAAYLQSNPGWPIYNPQWAIVTPDVNTLYNTAITYNKGAGVLHMLRYVLNDTNVFFNCLRGYAMDTAEFKYKTATTDDFTAKISQIAGQDLTWFVDQWVKQPNHPVYANLYQFADLGNGNWNVGFQAKQTQTNTPFHRMPLTIRITFASGPDTTFRIDNTTNNQIWIWTFNRQPTAFAFDPSNDIVLKTGTTAAGVVPGTIGITINTTEMPRVFSLMQNYPNPFNPVTNIRFDIPRRSNVTLKVFDITGKVVSEIYNGPSDPGKYTADFDATNLASGVYYYEINAVEPGSGNTFNSVKKMVVVK